MKSFGGIFERIVSSENLLRAAEVAARGKRDKPEVAAFLEHIEEEVNQLHAELTEGRYRTGGYRQFRVLEPKPRTISCAPFRDRVVHHAVCDVAMPLVERRFINDSYACRLGKGSHRAAERAQILSRRNSYFLKLDVRHFFESIDHEMLVCILSSLFREPQLKSLLEMIVRSPLPNVPVGKGLPIGNLTSQWFANLYLDGLDHQATEQWGASDYIRYMDDVIIFCDSKTDAWRLHGEVSNYLATERALGLKAEATRVAPCREGIPFLGLRIFPGCWRLQRQRFLRTRRRHRRLEAAVKFESGAGMRLIAGTRAAEGVLKWFGFKGVLPQGVEL